MPLVTNIKALIGHSHSKGDVFEEYVSRLFPECEYEILHYTPGKDVLSGRGIKSREYPDFQILHRPTGKTFWIECKYRSRLYDGKLVWAKDWQLERYKSFQEEHRPEKVYVIVGFGGLPMRPKRMYCFPLDMIDYPALYPTSIKRYIRPVKKNFQLLNGILR